MKTVILLAVAIVILSSVPFVSRQTDAAAQENAGPHAVAAQVNSSTAAATPAQNQSVRGHDELPGKFGVKSSMTQSAGAAGGLDEHAKDKAKTTTSSPRQ
jgi:hypothetical protein